MPITKYEGQTLEKQSLIVEECFFVNCVLRDCDLFYSGGDFEWANARYENCRWHFRGPALKTMQVMQTLGMLKQPTAPPSSPVSSSKLN
ncbi:MAG: hypothetical protein ACLP07_01225 [Terracidiphilus sp.]